jgi:hypothetical protein
MNPRKRTAVVNGTSGSLMVRYSVMGLPRVFWALHLAAVRLWGFTRCTRGGRETPVRTEPLPLPPVRRAVACSEQALINALCLGIAQG